MKLAELIRGASLAPDATATLATTATRAPPVATVATVAVATLVGEKPDTGTTRASLHALAELEGIDPALIRALPDADLQDCAGLPDAALTAYLYAMADTAEREARRVPATDTARAMCRHCGPVWASPAVAAVLPVVAGWPRALGCPWCVVRAAGKYVPHPAITSATCAHWTPDSVNPNGGMGRCKCGYHYPNERHACADYQPTSAS